MRDMGGLNLEGVLGRINLRECELCLLSYDAQGEVSAEKIWETISMTI